MIYKKLKFDYKQDAIVNSAFRFLGTYKPDIEYRRGDITLFNKKYYVYINDTPTSNNNPTNETFWEEYLTAVDKEIYSKKEVDDNFVSKSDTNIVRKNVENTFTQRQTFQGGLSSGGLSHFYQGLYTYADPYPGEQAPFRVLNKAYLEQRIVKNKKVMFEGFEWVQTSRYGSWSWLCTKKQAITFNPNTENVPEICGFSIKWKNGDNIFYKTATTFNAWVSQNEQDNSKMDLNLVITLNYNANDDRYNDVTNNIDSVNLVIKSNLNWE